MKLDVLKSWWHKIKTTGKSGVIISFISVLILELFEESIEELIAFGISVVVTKAISVMFVVTITQTIKVAIKKIIKVITYKKGADKMEKIKYFFNKLGEWFKTNPITIGASTVNLFSSSGVGVAILAVFRHYDVTLPDWATYLIVAVASVFFACLTEWGIIKSGWETPEQKATRCALKAEEKETKRIEAEAKAKLDAEVAEAAKIEAEAKAAIEAEEKAKAEAERAEAERRAKEEHQRKVDAKMYELKNLK